MVAHLWGSGVFWFTIVLLPVFCMSRDFAWKSYKRFARPEPYHIVQEIQKYVCVSAAFYRHLADTPFLPSGSIYPTIGHGKRSSHKLSKRFAHCRELGGIVDLHSRKQKKVKRRSSEYTIRLSRSRRVSKYPEVSVSISFEKLHIVGYK